MSLEDLDETQLSNIKQEHGSGWHLARLGWQIPGSFSDTTGEPDVVRHLPVSFKSEPTNLHHQTCLMARVKTWRQYAHACGVSPVVYHPPSEDIYVVQRTRVTRVRKWYKRLTSDPPPYDWELHATLEWITETSVSPTGLQATIDEDGSIIASHDCEPTVTGEDPPANWEGYSIPDYTFEPTDEPTVYEDLDTITGAAVAAFAQAEEVLISTGAWTVGKRFARRWFHNNTLDAGLAASATSSSAEVNRQTIELLVTNFRRPFVLKWIETTNPPTGPNTTEDREHIFSAANGWAHTLEVPYPAYGHEVSLGSFKVIPF